MLSAANLENILTGIPTLHLGVLGDLFLDRYLDIDPALTEASIETGLDAYQVVRVRPSPGAAGTVINNLAALGVGQIVPIGMTGADGEGYELRQELQRLGAVVLEAVFQTAHRRTPTYTKPLLLPAVGSGQLPRELNRLDIKNRLPLPAAVEQQILQALDHLWQRLDALLVLDQVSEENCGVVTTAVRQRLAELGNSQPDKWMLADSRQRIGLFRAVTLKPNRSECLNATGGSEVEAAAAELARRCGRPVFCTCGEQGMLVADPRQAQSLRRVPTYPVAGPIDTVGAGDSTSAALACALAAGADLLAAAAFANLVASITIQQIGTTGTATPAQLRQRWQETVEGK